MKEFLSRMQALLGDEYEAFLSYYQSDRFFRGLRVNTLKCTAEKLFAALPFAAETVRMAVG